METDKAKQGLARIPGELRVVVVLFMLAATVGMLYLHTWGGQSMFWQPIFGPAVMWACGRGYVNPALKHAPELEEFLYARAERFSREDLPEDIEVVPWDLELTADAEWQRYFDDPWLVSLMPYQRFHLYLLGAAALNWRVFGVSWPALYPFYAFLFGVTVVAGYGLFRLGMRRAFALACAVLLAVAPLHLQQLPHYRDYAKAPFILVALFLMGCLAKKPMRWPGVVGLAGLGGAVIGVGLGFRPDVNICLVPFVAVVLLFLPGGLLRAWRVKLAALAVLGAAYLVTAWPILTALSGGSNMPHWALLGLFAFCDARLGVASPIYDFGGPYLDLYVRAAFQSYAQRVAGHGERLCISTEVYDQYGWRYVLEIARRFPADLALRAYAAVLRVLDEMRVSVQDPAPRGLTHPVIVAAYKARVLALNSLVGSGRYYTGLALTLVGGYNLRLALCALFLLLYFAGYPGIQFNLRHCFHLEFISLWVLGFLAQQAVDAARKLKDAPTRCRLRAALPRPGAWWQPGVRRAAAFVAIACLGIVLPLAGLRAYQRVTVGTLLRAVASAPVEPLPCEQREVDGDTVLLHVPGLAEMAPAPPEKPGMPMQTQYLAAAFDEASRPAIPLVIRYEADDAEYDFSRDDVVLPPAASSEVPEGALGRVFFPVFVLSPAAYEGVEQRFIGVELRKEHLPYFRGLYRVTDLGALPLLLNVSLPHDWDRFPKRQVFTR